MITRRQAEQLAAAINALRPEWPIPSLVTMIAKIAHWPYLDAAVGLAYVAADPTSRTPARVLEQGPWRTIGVENPELEAIRDRDRKSRAAREAVWEARRLAILDCHICDDRGQVDGRPCDHQPDLADIARRGAAAARAEIKRGLSAPRPDAEPDQPRLRLRAWRGRPA